MPKIYVEKKVLETYDHESVLDALLREGIDHPFSCKSGVCQSCLMLMIEGTPSFESQYYLSPEQKEGGYFLPCSHIPTGDVRVSFCNHAPKQRPATITQKTLLTDSILKLTLQVQQAFDWKGGQYINLTLPGGITRCYSLANGANLEGIIECHIRLVPKGSGTPWLFYQACPGDHVHVRGPYGHCFYRNEERENFHMLLIGIGTGLSPVKAILDDALQQNHQGSITLIHCVRNKNDAYLNESLQSLCRIHQNIYYKVCRRGQPAEDGESYLYGDILEHLSHFLPSPQNTKVYACGSAETVKRIKSAAFLKGVSSANILGDAFLSPLKS